MGFFNRNYAIQVIILLFFVSNVTVTASPQKTSSMTIDKIHVATWNQFTQELHQFHLHQTKTHKIRTEEELGGYAGLPDFYREVRYYDEKSNRLLSRIQWEGDKSDTIHMIEVFVYHDNGKLKSDYLAAFLPEYRNAPIQTLINIHYENDELHSFRQFDASGARIHEQCKGQFFGEPILISLDEDDFDSTEKHIISTLASEEYLSCFEFTPSVMSNYNSPFNASGLQPPHIVNPNHRLNQGLAEADSVEKEIQRLTTLISNSSKPGKLLVKRGQAYFALQEFELAVNDYNQALKLDDTLDEAYFGRGMAKGRMGQVEKGIADLSIFISRNPTNSRAYTKRGVRYIWAGELSKARSDLSKAIAINPDNAEAHDDLGVVYASEGNYSKALEHFNKVVTIDPSYQKGFHNLAMAYYISGKNQQALRSINAALNISPNNKNSLLLKGEIVAGLGMKKEAQAITERAEFLPDGNWSERFSVR